MSIALAYHTTLHQADELEWLIDGCTRNERGAQNKLFQMFYPRMQAMVRRYFSDEDAAQEILSNGFLKAFKKIDQYGFRGSFEGWLRSIFRHAISDYVAQNVRYKENILLVEKDEYVHRDFVENLYYKDLLKLVHELPDQFRVAFNLFAVEGLSHREIAKMLDVKEGTSKWYVSRAREILKERIEELGLHLKK